MVNINSVESLNKRSYSNNHWIM